MARKRRRTPTLLQMEVVECGAACLGMVLGYHGRHVPLEALRHECGVSRDGTKASNIVAAARRFGLEARGFSVDTPDGLRSMALPMIVFWEFNHFVVVEGFGRGVVYLNDPANGPRSVTDREFDQSFTGIALTFTPGPGFLPGGRRGTLRAGLLSRLGPAWAGFLFVVLISLLLTLPGLLGPAVSRVYVDYLLVASYLDWLKPLVAAAAGIALLRVILVAVERHTLLRVQTKLAIVGAVRFLWHVLRLPVGFFAQRYAGEIAIRMNLNDRIARLIAGDLAATVIALLTMGLFAALMAVYDPVLTAVAVGLASLNLLTFLLVSRSLSTAAQRLLVDQGRLWGLAMQSLQQIESFKAAGTEDLFFARWAGHHAKVINSQQVLARQRLILSVSPVLLTLAGSVVVLVLGGTRVMEGALTIGSLVAFQALAIGFFAPVLGLVELGGQVLEAQGEIIRLDDVMAHPADPAFARSATVPATAAPAGPPVDDGRPPSATAVAEAAPATQQLFSHPPVKLSGLVELRGVAYGYNPNEPPLIEDLSLTVAPGARVALVGGSGSGKSTVGRVIAGLYPPRAGEVRFDGVAIGDLPWRMLRNSIAVVDQDIALFEGSVADNISLWDPTLPQERIIRAARDAEIHEEISRRAEAYDFPVQENGRNFSGGQRQRIELARALALDPALLILDEATSALDAVTEKRVIDNIRRRGCSCVVIAHRLSTIRDCDEIILLDRGRVVERGRHDALMALGGRYRDLLES